MPAGISSIRRMSCSGSDLKIISQTPKQPPYMKIRVIYNYFLKILGIREMLPGDILRSKPIRESHETLVYFTPCDGLFLNGVKMLCRQSVAEKLKRVAKQLSEKGLGIYIYELYRSPEQQQMRLQETYNRYGDRFSNKDELERYVRRCTAGVGGGHQTGGAVDLTLCDKNGIPLDMGSEYPVKCPEMVTAYHLSPLVDERRRLLCNVMYKEGFANYPGEWWHFSYGDQLWAAYRYKRHAIYGSINSASIEEKLGL